MSSTVSTCPYALCEFKNSLGYCKLTACIKHGETTSQPTLSTVHCGACDELEAGDTLYSHTSLDDGDMYSAIRNIRFCPKCGKKLLTFLEKRRRCRGNERV